MSHLSEAPLDVAAIRARVDDEAFGAVIVFEGVARTSSGADAHAGRRVTGLQYEAWPSVAERELAAVEAEAEARWPGIRVVIVHRTGEVPIGAPAVVVAVGAPHRAEAYEASRFAIDALKARVPLWKQERYDDGSAWIGNRP